MFGKKLKCPRCKGTNIRVEMLPDMMNSKRSGNGIVGNTYNAARGLASIATLGLAGKVLPKAEGKTKTKIAKQKYAICNSCGHTWKI